MRVGGRRLRLWRRSQTRRLIEAHGRGYVLAVTSAQRLGLKPVEDWLEDVPARGWTRLSAGDGAKGPRLYDWAYLPYRHRRRCRAGSPGC